MAGVCKAIRRAETWSDYKTGRRSADEEVRSMRFCLVDSLASLADHITPSKRLPTFPTTRLTIITSTNWSDWWCCHSTPTYLTAYVYDFSHALNDSRKWSVILVNMDICSTHYILVLVEKVTFSWWKWVIDLFNYFYSVQEFSIPL